MISMEGATVTMINGYPTADPAGIVVAANVSSTDFNLVGGSPYAVASDTGHASCMVTYAAATTTAPLVVDRTTNVTSGNCS